MPGRGQIIQNYNLGRHRSTDLITSPRSRDTAPSKARLHSASNKVHKHNKRLKALSLKQQKGIAQGVYKNIRKGAAIRRLKSEDRPNIEENPLESSHYSEIKGI